MWQSPVGEPLLATRKALGSIPSATKARLHAKSLLSVPRGEGDLPFRTCFPGGHVTGTGLLEATPAPTEQGSLHFQGLCLLWLP